MDVKTILTTYPELIYDLEKNFLDLNEAVETTDQHVKQIVDTTVFNVAADAKDLSLTNETLRKKEVTNRLQNSLEYEELLAELKANTLIKKKLLIEIAFRKQEFRAAESLSRL